MLTKFINSEDMNNNGSNNSFCLCFILQRLQVFRKSWEASPNEPSRVIALFMKYMERYLRAKKAVSAYDSWLIEIESADWMGPWKMINKRTYLRLQCEYIERFYDNRQMPAVMREMMRANVFLR